MWELEVQASAMAWDLDMDDINVEDDNSKLWVPVMAQMLNLGAAEESRPFPPMGPVMPPRQMTIYAVLYHPSS